MRVFEECGVEMGVTVTLIFFLHAGSTRPFPVPFPVPSPSYTPSHPAHDDVLVSLLYIASRASAFGHDVMCECVFWILRRSVDREMRPIRRDVLPGHYITSFPSTTTVFNLLYAWAPPPTTTEMTTLRPTRWQLRTARRYIYRIYLSAGSCFKKQFCFLKQYRSEKFTVFFFLSTEKMLSD